MLSACLYIVLYNNPKSVSHAELPAPHSVLSLERILCIYAPSQSKQTLRPDSMRLSNALTVGDCFIPHPFIPHFGHLLLSPLNAPLAVSQAPSLRPSSLHPPRHADEEETEDPLTPLF